MRGVDAAASVVDPVAVEGAHAVVTVECEFVDGRRYGKDAESDDENDECGHGSKSMSGGFLPTVAG